MAWGRVSALRAVLRVTWTVSRRRQRSLIKIPANNILYAAAAFVFMIDPFASVFLLELAALVLVFPMSADPLGLTPRSRLGVWPVTAGERRLLRAITPWLNPLTWTVAAVVLWKRVGWSLAALIGGLFLVAFVAPARAGGAGRGGVLRFIPRLPGAIGMLVQKDLRGIVTTLDFYCALVPAAAAAGYRLAGMLPHEAGLPLTCLVLLAISTCAQTLFGLDGPAGVTRYRLMPMAGWKAVLAKDLAFLLVVVLLTALLAPLAGLSGGITALATVRKAAIIESRPQIRWRLQAGTAFGPAIVQIVAMMAVASVTDIKGPLVLAPCLLLWAVSIWRGGRMLDRQPA